MTMKKKPVSDEVLHASSTIDAEDLSVHPVTVLRREETNNAGNIKGLTDTVVWRPGAGILVDLIVGELFASRDVLAAHSLVHVGLDTTRGDTVDGNLLLTSIWSMSVVVQKI
jgi:hypothetical protein